MRPRAGGWAGAPAVAAVAAPWMVAVVALVVILGAGGGDCLRNVNLIIQPSAVEKGQQARLVCDYDLEGDSLYSVKWYRGSREFYRYTPSNKEATRTKVFALPGLNVDLSHSNATQVVLTNVGFSLTGNVSCEVTTDKPRLLMAQAGALMTVVALPRSPPKVYTNHDKYDLGDRLVANCTAPPAVPPAQLSFQINNRTAPSADTSYHETEEHEQWSALAIDVLLTRGHFTHGRLTLQCTATLPGGFALKSDVLELGARPSEPVPERVTLPSSGWRCGGPPSLVVVALLLLLGAPGPRHLARLQRMLR